MRIGFYAPFKPIDHPTPSGDRTIGRGLFDFLLAYGHDIQVQSRFRARWIYRQPFRWPALLWERRRVLQKFRKDPMDVWLTYHTYYKSPDLIGPFVCRNTGVPYAVFQGIYSTKRRRDFLTWPGFVLNRQALLSATQVFTNRRLDQKNLQRILPRDRINYIRPGIAPGRYVRDRAAGAELMRRWRIQDAPVVLSAAMFRPDVKTEGLIFLITACAALKRDGFRFHLVIAGDGLEAERLQRLGRDALRDTVHFAGNIPPEEMPDFYSAGEIFAFPGIRESLGMVFLEAQACGLPVVAFDNGGIPEVVARDRTGFLVPPFDQESFVRQLRILIENTDLRRQMGDAARQYVRRFHDVETNYQLIEKKLLSLV